MLKDTKFCIFLNTTDFKKELYYKLAIVEFILFIMEMKTFSSDSFENHTNGVYLAENYMIPTFSGLIV